MPEARLRWKMFQLSLSSFVSSPGTSFETRRIQWKLQVSSTSTKQMNKTPQESNLRHGELKYWYIPRQYFLLRHVWVTDSFSEYCLSYNWLNDNKFWILPVYLVHSRPPKTGFKLFPLGDFRSLSSQPTFPFTLLFFFNNDTFGHIDVLDRKSVV